MTNDKVYFKDLTEDVQKEITGTLEKAGEEFLRLGEVAEERLLKFLLLANAGGAIAGAGFIGQIEGKVPRLAIIALSFYLLGVILSGALAYLSVFEKRDMAQNFQNDKYKFLNNTLEVSQIFEQTLKATRKKSQWIKVVEPPAFVCFIAGSANSIFVLIFP